MEIWLNWICRDKARGDLVGTMQSTVFPQRREALVAYAVYRRYQGNGFAHEACRAVISHLQERYGIDRIYAEMSTANKASFRLAESLGFKRVETRRAVDLGGITGDEYLYELAR
jgi:RimJ/RimL family protein N-acetyltransferase